MWRFLGNVEKPQLKTTQSEAEKLKYQTNYDKNKRQRKFQSDWGNRRKKLLGPCKLYWAPKSEKLGAQVAPE